MHYGPNSDGMTKATGDLKEISLAKVKLGEKPTIVIERIVICFETNEMKIMLVLIQTHHLP